MAAKACYQVVRMKPVERTGNLGGRPFFLAGQFGPPVKAPPEGHKFGDVAICQNDWLAGAGSPPASGSFAVRRGGVGKLAPHEVILVAKLADKRGPHLGKAR